MRSIGVAVVVVLLGFALFYWLGTGPLTLLYTLRWTADIILFFGSIAVVAAFQVPRSAPWSLGGYVLGVTLGELIGEQIYQAQHARLQAQLRDPTYWPDWEPHHPGWWIAIMVFLTVTAIGYRLGRRASRRAHTPPERTPAQVS